MHITEFEKLNYNYLIQELALKNEYGSISRKSTLNELNVEECNINKKIKLQPLSKSKLSDDTGSFSSQSIIKNNENEFNEQELKRISNKIFPVDYDINNYNYEYNESSSKTNLFCNNKNNNLSYQNNENEKSLTNINANNSKDNNDDESFPDKRQINKNLVNEKYDLNESDDEIYESEDENENDNINNTHNPNSNNESEEQDGNIFRRGQQKFISSPNYGTKNINRLYHLLNSVTPIYKSTNGMIDNANDENEKEYFSNNNGISNNQKKFKQLRFDDDILNKLEKSEIDNIIESSNTQFNSEYDNYVDLSCKLLNSRIRLGKPIPIELEIVNRGSKTIPYLKFVVSAITNNENNESFCNDKIMFAYFLEPGKRCVKDFSLEPYLWNNEEDSFYDDMKNLNLSANLGSNTLYSTSNLANSKLNIITNKNFSSYYYYSKLYARNKYQKGKVSLSKNKSLNSLTNIFDLATAVDKDDYYDNENQNDINYNSLRVIPKETKLMLNNLPSSIKINIYKENGELIQSNNSEFTLKSEYFTQDFYLLGQYFKLNENEENESLKNKPNKYKKYRKSKSYSLNILLVNSSVELKNKFIHSLEYSLFVEKQLLSKGNVHEFRDLLIENNSYEYYKDSPSKFYWNNNKDYYQEIKMANHFPKNIKFYDCPCNDRISNEKKIKKTQSLVENNLKSKYNSLMKVNSLIKNKLNILSSMTSEGEIKMLSKISKEQKEIKNNDKEPYCYWLDGDEAELISKGELPLGKKILGEKIYYNDIDDDFYSDTLKKNPIHNVIYLFSQTQIENASSDDINNIKDNINKLLKLKKELNICIFIDDCELINKEYDNIKEYKESLKLKSSSLLKVDKEMIYVVPYCIDRKINYENIKDINKKLYIMNSHEKVKKENQEILNFLNIEFLYLIMQKAEDEYSKLCLK